MILVWSRKAITKELSGDGRASEQLTLAEIRELTSSTTLM